MPKLNTKNLSKKLNSNSLGGHKVLKLRTQLPLKDLFINREIEFDYTLESLKILYSNLDISEPTAMLT